MTLKVIDGVFIDAGPDDWQGEVLAMIRQQQVTDPPLTRPSRGTQPQPIPSRRLDSPYGFRMTIDAPIALDLAAMEANGGS